ncbi:MAG: aldo/keto reductase [Ignavibacterium album]|uniref:aldo/keto reductase n=1 Tax=Ignavibacterium album TaxID=591197 RepID=UPI0026EB1657|nr:aldo/keto reductase [Ignavibacterium album]MBI5662538.1 aldo/keto reductase [Ignavibacterium album]
MIYRELGKTGLKVSAIGFGAGEIGDYSISDSEVDKLLNAALDLGINLIDTARGYYASEERIGRFLSHRRNEFILSTKVGYGIEGYNDWTYEIILAGIDEALRVMKTDYIDIVHLHSCDINVLKKGEVTEALLKAKQMGKIRVAAYSGENDALEYAINSDKFDSIMTSVNICDQYSLNNLIPMAKQKDLGVIAKRPIANAPWRFVERPVGNYAEEYWLRWKEMNLPESENWLDTFLRFSVYADGIDSAIIGSTNVNHLQTDIQIIEKGPLNPALANYIKTSFNEYWMGLI